MFQVKSAVRETKRRGGAGHDIDTTCLAQLGADLTLNPKYRCEHRRLSYTYVLPTELLLAAVTFEWQARFAYQIRPAA